MLKDEFNNPERTCFKFKIDFLIQSTCYFTASAPARPGGRPQPQPTLETTLRATPGPRYRRQRGTPFPPWSFWTKTPSKVKFLQLRADKLEKKPNKPKSKFCQIFWGGLGRRGEITQRPRKPVLSRYAEKPVCASPPLKTLAKANLSQAEFTFQGQKE